MQALVPKTITDTNLTYSTVAEPDPLAVMPDGVVGEVLWVGGTTYNAGQRVIRTGTHRVYRRLTTGHSTAAPELAPLEWFDESSTNKWKWADTQANSQTTSSSPYELTLNPGAISDIEFLALEGVDTIEVKLYTETGGTLVYESILSTDEFMGADPHWALYFEAPRQGTSFSLSGLPVYPDCEVSIKLSSYDASAMKVGLIAFGSYQDIGLSQFGFSTKYRNYSFTKTDEYGTTTFRPGKKAKDLTGTAVLHVEEANGVDAGVAELLDIGAVYVPSQAPEHRFLKTWGRLQTDMSLDAPDLVQMQITIEGLI